MPIPNILWISIVDYTAVKYEYHFDKKKESKYEYRVLWAIYVCLFILFYMFLCPEMYYIFSFNFHAHC